MKKLMIFFLIFLVLWEGIYKFVNTKEKNYFIQENKKTINNSSEDKYNANIKNDISAKEAIAGYLTAQDAILVDNSHGEILLDKNSSERCYPASTTKILTALLAIENCNLNEKVKVGKEVCLPLPDSSLAGLRYGETLTMEQLLNALLVPSGNDAAYTIAVYVARKVSENDNLSVNQAVKYFIELMNQKAKELGAKNSNFANPDGYPNPNHYTTAYDISLIAREALKYKEFREIVSTQTYRLPDVETVGKNGVTHREKRVLTNTDELILKNSSNYFQFAIGVKTGYSKEAGYCLVSAAKENGRDILAVVMNDSEENVWSDSKALLKYGIEN